MLNTTFEDRLNAHKTLSEERKAEIRRRRELNEAKKVEREEQREHTIWQQQKDKYEASLALQDQLRVEREQRKIRVEQRKRDEYLEQLQGDFSRSVHRMTLLRKQPPVEILNKARALYNQATIGDCDDSASDTAEVLHEWHTFKGKTKAEAMDLYVRHHNYTVTHYGWRPMGHVWDKYGNRLPGVEDCTMCVPLWDGWKPPKGWDGSDDAEMH